MSHKNNRTVFKSRPISLDSFDMGQYGHQYYDITSDGIIYYSTTEVCLSFKWY